jgi:hypothetical protein
MDSLIAKALITSAVSMLLAALAMRSGLAKAIERDYVAHEFQFRSGEWLAELRLGRVCSTGQILRGGQRTNCRRLATSRKRTFECQRP